MTLVPVNKETLAGKRLKPISSYDFLRKVPFCEIFAGEGPNVAAQFPIVFVKQGDAYVLAALFAHRPDDNLFVNAAGQWIGGFLPAALRRYPFAVGQTQDGTPVLLIEDASGLLAEDEGEPLFGEDQSKEMESPVGRVLALSGWINAQIQITKPLVAKIAAAGLLEPATFNFVEDGEQKSTGGFFVVEEKKLMALSAEVLQDLKAANVMPLIYMHLGSLLHVPVLQRLLEERSAAKAK